MKEKIKIKVCGMRDPSNILALVKLQPDYIGFIFYHKSERYAGEMIDKQVIAAIPPGIKKVGVFVNRPVNELMARFKMNSLDYVQLHGDEDVEYCKKLYYTGIPFIKVFRVSGKLDTEEMDKYKMYSAAFLLDTKTKKYGGSGRSFDWSILKGYQFDVPLILSGGICPGDAKKIRKLRHPQLHAVDINSCFEKAPGIKEIKKIENFKNKLLK